MPSFNQMHEWVNGWVEARVPARRRRGAVGKALIVWLATGSLGAAVVAFILFRMMGC